MADKARVMRRAAELMRKEGLNRSHAMTRAWAEEKQLKVTVSDFMNEVYEEIKRPVYDQYAENHAFYLYKIEKHWDSKKIVWVLFSKSGELLATSIKDGDEWQEIAIMTNNRTIKALREEMEDSQNLEMILRSEI